jgi:hypothetical protein
VGGLMRNLIEKIYTSSKVIITLGYGFEFRKNPRRKGKILYHEQTEHPSKNTLLDEESEELIKKIEADYNKIFCYSYCRYFDRCKKEKCYIKKGDNDEK